MSTSSISAYSHDTGAGSIEKDFTAPDRPLRPTTATPSQRTRSFSSTLLGRKRPKSLVLGADEIQAANGFQHENAVIEEPLPEQQIEEATSGTTLKGKFRRASLSLMKGFGQRRDRRCSEPEKNHHIEHTARPSTAHSAWHKLRQATSFRHSRIHNGRINGEFGGLDTIYSPMESNFPSVPVPGHGLEPPIIPTHTGAAAKASAAYQNEYLAMRQREDWLGYQLQNDGESGIGISLSNLDELDATTSNALENSAVSRVDFISKLPSELAVQILAHLDVTHLTAAARVSRAWNEIAQDQQIWRQSFLREKTMTYATSLPIEPGTGLGVPAIRPGNDWQKIYRSKQELDQKWKEGTEARAVYLNGHLDSIYCVQFDESKIITGSRDKTIRIWDMHTYQCRLVIGPPEVVNQTSVLFDEAGRPVHYASVPGDDRANESVPATVSFPTHHKASILCLQYDDDILVTGSSDGTCIVYSIKSGYRPIRRLQHHTAAVLDLAFDDKHIVTCSKDITICVWDRATGALLKQLRGHTGPVNAVQLRGNSIVSCSGDFRVKLWNIDSGKVIREFEGHTKGLACSQFSEDGRYIASAGSDKVIRIWDANTGECIREMGAHEKLVRSLHIDSVSGRLISGSYDTDIKVFDMETGDLLLDFPRWHASWVLSAKSDYRRIVSTGQDPKILIMDFGADVKNIGMLESVPQADVARDAGFI
ncbi:putative F-box and WD40 domain protein [Xylariales sp. PMI_506]|nr:putative F-box and WD40 domain protein [Xylariales sp. PMI_506]